MREHAEALRAHREHFSLFLADISAPRERAMPHAAARKVKEYLETRLSAFRIGEGLAARRSAGRIAISTSSQDKLRAQGGSHRLGAQGNVLSEAALDLGPTKGRNSAAAAVVLAAAIRGAE